MTELEDVTRSYDTLDRLHETSTSILALNPKDMTDKERRKENKRKEAISKVLEYAEQNEANLQEIVYRARKHSNTLVSPEDTTHIERRFSAFSCCGSKSKKAFPLTQKEELETYEYEQDQKKEREKLRKDRVQSITKVMNYTEQHGKEMEKVLLRGKKRDRPISAGTFLRRNSYTNNDNENKGEKGSTRTSQVKRNLSLYIPNSEPLNLFQLRHQTSSPPDISQINKSDKQDEITRVQPAQRPVQVQRSRSKSGTDSGMGTYDMSASNTLDSIRPHSSNRNNEAEVVPARDPRQEQTNTRDNSPMKERRDNAEPEEAVSLEKAHRSISFSSIYKNVDKIYMKSRENSRTKQKSNSFASPRQTPQGSPSKLSIHRDQARQGPLNDRPVSVSYPVKAPSFMLTRQPPLSRRTSGKQENINRVSSSFVHSSNHATASISYNNEVVEALSRQLSCKINHPNYTSIDLQQHEIYNIMRSTCCQTCDGSQNNSIASEFYSASTASNGNNSDSVSVSLKQGFQIKNNGSSIKRRNNSRRLAENRIIEASINKKRASREDSILAVKAIASRVLEDYRVSTMDVVDQSINEFNRKFTYFGLQYGSNE